MMTETRGASHRTARGIVRTAARFAPRGQRERMTREWDAELERAFQIGGGWDVTWNALGAFADAIALRRAAVPSEASGSLSAWLVGVAWDARVAWRGLRRTPGFTVVAVLTLAVGLGGVASIYTVIDRVVLDPLPYPEPDRLVRIQNRVPGVDPQAVWNLSTAQWVHFTERSRTLEDIGLYLGDTSGRPGTNLMTPEGPYRTRGVAVTASMMRLLGVRPHLGRLITEEDDRPGAPLAILLTYEFWTGPLGGDPDVIGTSLFPNQSNEVVVGVMEPGVEIPGWPPGIGVDFWFPMQTDRAGPFGNSHGFPGIGRLASGATAEDVEAELAGLTRELPERFARAYGGGFIEQYGFHTTVTPLKDDVVGTLARDLWILLAGVALVLIVACANVLNLFAVRTEARTREFRLRAALGAGRAALARYALVEGTLLALLGGTLAAAVATWVVPGMIALAPEALPRLADVGIGADGVALTALLSLAVGFGIALHGLASGRVASSGSALPRGGRGGGGGRGPRRLRSVLVVAQVALAATLTVGAGLLVVGLRDLRATSVGFESERVLAVDLYADGARYPEDTDLWRLYRTIRDRVSTIPGVVAAGLGEELPVTGRFGCVVQGFEDEAVEERIRAAGMTTCAGEETVTPGYFDALGIPVLQGRGFEDDDSDEPTRAAVVVSRAFAERFWPGENPIGRGVAPGGRNIPPFFHVVGVVGDVPRTAEAGERPLSEEAVAVYYPVVANPDVPGNWGRWWPGYLTLVVRTDGMDPMAAFSDVRSILSEIDPQVPLANVRSMEAVVQTALASVSFVSVLFAIAAVVALVLAAVGLYGVISYVVVCRTRELGVRAAVGARRGQLERMVLGQTLALVVLGLLVGAPLGYAAVRVAQAVLIGVDVLDPTAYLLAGLAMLVVAVGAGWLPARRAASVDPMEVLRGE